MRTVFWFLLALTVIVWAASKASKVFFGRRRKPPPGPAPPLEPPPAEPLRDSGTSIASYFAAPSAGHPTACLVAVEGGIRGERFFIEKDSVQLGAASENDIVLPDDDYVSGFHAAIRFSNGSLLLSDLDSTNGTFFNDEPVTTTRVLGIGDRIRMGAIVLELCVPETHSKVPVRPDPPTPRKPGGTKVR